LTKTDLQKAKVVAQIDDKFICCAVPNPGNQPGSVLVLVDQHAADERIRVERFLRQVLREFKCGSVAATLLDTPHEVQLLNEQVVFLGNHPQSQHLLGRWGFQISQFVSTTSPLLSVISVPTLLLSRLGPKGGSEVRKIVSGYVAFLQSQPISSLASLAAIEDDGGQLGLDATGLLRWMPERMKELVDSKACRGEIH
jgi:DNA mismatch repair protein MLH3